MENREENIYFNLIRNETSLTEAFCNLLHYQAFRDLFLEFVNIEGVKLNTVKYSDFSTEKDFGFDKTEENEKDKKIGRGDLILEYDNLDYIFEIKIETTTATTKNQPLGYFKYLRNQMSIGFKKRLFFILPKGYRYKRELKEKTFDNNIKVLDKNILYWEDFLEKLKNSGLLNLNTVLKDFYEIMNYRWFYFYKFSFSKIELNYMFKKEKLEMTNTAIPTIMRKLISIVDNMAIKFDIRQNSLYKTDEDYGFFIKDKESNNVLWFGITYEIWEKEGIPLTIGTDNSIETNIYYKKLQDNPDSKEYDFGDFQYLYISINNLIEDSRDTNGIEKKINEVINTIGLEIK